MLGITPFGQFHTVLALVALAAGLVAFVRFGEIAYASRSGRAYFWFTAATCVTGLFIFNKGGFGPPHVLSIVTLLVLAFAWTAERRSAGGWLRLAAMVAYTFTYFLHMIPGFTETSTRVPPGQPWASGPEDPNLQLAVGLAFAVFLLGAGYQLWRRRRSRGVQPA